MPESNDTMTYRNAAAPTLNLKFFSIPRNAVIAIVRKRSRKIHLCPVSMRIIEKIQRHGEEVNQTIIFDEPTSGLDLYHMKEVAQNMEHLKTQGKTVFLITHDLEVVMECCTHVLYFENGEAVGSSPLNSESCEKLKSFFDNIHANNKILQ